MFINNIVITPVMAIQIIIPDTSVLYPIETSFKDYQKKRDYPLYLTRDKVIDDTVVLDIDPIFLKEDPGNEGHYFCLDGTFRTSLASLFGIGIEALVFQNTDDCDSISNKLRRNFLYAHAYGIRAQQAGVNSFKDLAKGINIEWLDTDMREKYKVMI